METKEVLKKVKSGMVFYSAAENVYLRLREDIEKGDYFPALFFCDRNSDIPFKITGDLKEAKEIKDWEKIEG